MSATVLTKKGEKETAEREREGAVEGKIEERVEYERCACLSCNFPETTVHGLDFVEMPAVVRPRSSRTREAGRKGQQTKA